MEIVFKKSSVTILFILSIVFTLLLSLFAVTPALAHQSPLGCTGSGLGISLFSNNTQVHIGDTILYSAVVFNGSGSGPIVCDATGITASIVTPDGVTHPLTLTRTTLLNGESDTYTNVVSYVAASADVNILNGTLAATASDAGTIHQNVVDSSAGANQGLNVFVLNTLHVVKIVINDDGGTSVAADFNLHVKSSGVDVSGSPTVGTGAPGTLYDIIAGTYTVSEDVNASYTSSFSGDCDSSGNVTLLAGDDKTCTITNNDILVTIPAAPVSSPTPSSPPSDTPSTSSSSNNSPVCTSSGITTIPTIIRATRLSPTSIFVNWGPYDGLNDFMVQYGFENGKWLFNTKISGFSTTINDLPANQSIWIHVAATDNCIVGTYGPAVLVGGTAKTNSPGFPNTGSPLLPNTGFNPHIQNRSLETQIGIFFGLVIFYIAKKVYTFSSK